MEKRTVKDLKIGSKVWEVNDIIITQVEITSLDIRKAIGTSSHHYSVKNYNEISEYNSFVSDYKTTIFLNQPDAIRCVKNKITELIKGNNKKIVDLIEVNNKLTEELNSY